MNFNLKKISLLMGLISIGFMQHSNVLGSEFLVCFARQGNGFSGKSHASCVECGQDLNARCLQFCCKNNDINCESKNYGFGSQGCDHKREDVFRKMQQNGYFCFVRSRELKSHSYFYEFNEESIKELAQNGWAYCAYCARNIIKREVASSVIEALKNARIDNGCMICLSKYAPGEAVRSCSNGHIFHDSCVNTWINEGHKCPTCKEKNILPSRFYIEQKGQELILVHEQIDPKTAYICNDVNGTSDRDFDLSNCGDPKDDIYEKIVKKHK